MENPTTVFGGATQKAPQLDHQSRLPDDAILRGMPPVNLLLTGGDVVVQSVLETLLSDHDLPIASWWPGQRLVLPMARPSMMILHHVGALALEDQQHLLEWLERDIGRTKVVSTTPAPLMPLVEKGAFNDTLYYRLNTVSIEVSVAR
jgi:hypothetical protein